MPPDLRVVHLPNAHSLTWDDCRLLVESVVDYAIFMLDASGYVATWNGGARRLKGYAPEEIIGRHFSAFYTPEDQASGKPARILESALQVGRHEDEGWRVRKDGSRFWANVVVTALHDDRGDHRGFAKITRDLTDRHQAEEDLRRSEERFRLLVDNVADYAIYLLDQDGRITSWNLGAQRMKGYFAGEIMGQSFDLFFPEDDVASGKPQRELASAAMYGRFEDEGWRVRKDGSRFWANAILTALYDAHGTPIGYAKITRDLTVRREAEEKARQLVREQTARRVAEDAERQRRESEVKYRSLSNRLEIVLEGVADGITVQDRSDRLVFANTAAAKLCGFRSAAELMNTPPAEVVARFEVLDTNGQPFPLERLPGRRVLAGEGPNTALIHVRERATSRDWWVQLRGSPALDASGKPELAINIWHDVTAERRQEGRAKYLVDAAAALGKSLDYDEMLSALAEVLVPGLGDWCSIYMVDGDRLRDVAVAHADREKHDLVERCRRLFPSDARRATGVWHVVRTGEPAVFNDITEEMLRAWIPDVEAQSLLQAIGTRAVLIVPIHARSGVLGALALISGDPHRRYDDGDVSLAEELGARAGVALEHARLYHAARTAAKAAEEAARIAEEASRAKDEFLATVSHELRTPLNAILGWSSILSARSQNSSDAKPIEVIRRNAMAQVKIIDDILDVSRLVTGKLRVETKPTDIVVVARDAMEVVRSSAHAKGVELEFASSVDSCVLAADAERLQQVIWNLLSNAVKFTEPGGRVSMFVREELAQVTLEVTDTGIGIAPDFLPLMFERFRQADSSTTRQFAGLGLGLSLVRHIVELHGGRVSAASEGLGKGSTITVTLPLRAVTGAANEDMLATERTPASIVVSPAPLSGLRILVVDDEPDARDLLAVVLTQAGAEVETASSASQGLEVFKQLHPAVLISDVGMPREDGYSLMRRIRSLPAEEGGSTPALALTAFAREQDREKAISAGFTAHLSKPASPDALVAAVRSLIDPQQAHGDKK